MHAHEAVIDRIYSKPEERYVVLYPRERECLLWTARGKTAWEISNILNLSQQTVTAYLKSATQKLGVHSKTHAVVKAILFGLIIP
jgi:DNA-binding CsgD family transcriptional regulator